MDKMNADKTNPLKAEAINPKEWFFLEFRFYPCSSYVSVVK
jgi:hypothetical protein